FISIPFFFSSRRRHTRSKRDWSSDVCSSDLVIFTTAGRMRLPETDACFVLGLAEGEFPQTPGDTGLLTHADRDAMIAQGAELPRSEERRVGKEGRSQWGGERYIKKEV